MRKITTSVHPTLARNYEEKQHEGTNIQRQTLDQYVSINKANKAIIDYIYTDKQPHITGVKALVILECRTVLHNASYVQDNQF